MFRPSAKPFSDRCLSLAEREEIALMRAPNCSMRKIARLLGQAASTISRELRWDAATRGGGLVSRATTAQWYAERSVARQPKPAKQVGNHALRHDMHERLSGLIMTPQGLALAGPQVAWNGRRHGQRQKRDGPGH
jgi:IS30 family transposase